MRPSVARRGGFGRRSLGPAPDGAPYGARSDAAEVRRKQGASRRALLLAAALAAIRARSAAATGALRLVALGDSLTAGLGLPLEASFPVLLQHALADKGVAAQIANAGVSGDTAEDGLARLDWSVPQGTQGVILELGANDGLRGMPPAGSQKARDAIITKQLDRRIAVLLCGMDAPRNLGTDYVAGFDGIYPRLAAKYGLDLYPFFLDGVAGDGSLTQPDGLHPNAAGVRAIVAKMLPVVQQFTAKLAA